jgi:dTDP-4-amino-4,6-dideoxygalactose transaminase
VFVDIKADCFTINEKLILSRITSNTKAIIPVHLYGHPCEMDSIMEIANQHKLIVIEDCAQSHGSSYKGKMTGTIGHAASFSFYPGKNLGAYGDAGGMSIKDPEILEQARRIANHGQVSKHNHITTGRNSRLDGIQAAVLQVKLPYLGSWNQKRCAVAEKYIRKLAHLPLILPKSSKDVQHVYHLFVIRNVHRDNLAKQLAENGIATSIHYPVALPAMRAFQHLDLKVKDYPVAMKAASEILSLPIYPEMDDAQLNYVCECIDKVLR